MQMQTQTQMQHVEKERRRTAEQRRKDEAGTCVRFTASFRWTFSS
jgi:hypothetical protein